MAKKPRKIQRATLIIVGEGIYDKAFLDHMKSIYDTRDTNQKVTIKPGDGGSPGDVIHTVIKERHVQYSRRCILIDSDIPLNDEDKNKIRKHKIIVIQSKPLCLEGMLLDILDQSPPCSSQECKKVLHPQLSGPPSRKESYQQLFTKQVLDRSTKEQIIKLKKLLLNDK